MIEAGVLGGVALLVGAIAWSIKTSGPELRCWIVMSWARSDAKQKKADAVSTPQISPARRPAAP